MRVLGLVHPPNFIVLYEVGVCGCEKNPRVQTHTRYVKERDRRGTSTGTDVTVFADGTVEINVGARMTVQRGQPALGKGVLEAQAHLVLAVEKPEFDFYVPTVRYTWRWETNLRHALEFRAAEVCCAFTAVCHQVL